MREEIKKRVEMIRRGEVPEGYKQTKVGIIPVEWGVKKFGNIVEKSALGGNYSNSTEISKFPLIKMGNIARGKIDLTKIEYISKGEIPDSKHKLKKGDFLFNTRNTLELVGKVSVWRNELDTAYFNSNLLKITFKNDYVHNNYFMNYFFNSENALSMLKAFAIGTTSVAAIYNRDLFKMNISLPPLQEQDYISQILSTADKAIETTQSLITLKQQKKIWLMQNLLTGKVHLPEYDTFPVPVQERIRMINDGLVPEGYKQTKVGIIPVKWEVKELGKITRTFSGGTPKSDNPEYYNGKIPWINSSDLNKTFIKSVSKYITQKGLENSSAKMVQKGTLLFALYGATAGVPAITKIDAAINQAVLAIIVNKNSETYIFYLLKHLKKHIVSKYTQGGQPNLSGKIMKELTIHIPSLREQTAIANILTTADKEIDLLNQKLETLKQQKKALMQLLLTGIVRTTGLKIN